MNVVLTISLLQIQEEKMCRPETEFWTLQLELMEKSI